MTTYTVSFSDPTGRFTTQAANIQANVLYAANAINRWVPGLGDINISVTIDAAVATANGGSATSVEGVPLAGVRIFSQGYASEVATGADPNGAVADVLIRVGADFLANTYWIDPTPETSNDIPTRGYDFISGMTHELLHGLAFNGWRDWTTGALPGSYMSTYDQHVQMIGGAPYFTGATARAVYGGNVPLWPGNLFHYGSPTESRAGLLGGVLQGSGRENGRRYDLNDLDLAILQDTGVRISRPTSGSEGADILSSPLQGSFAGLSGNDTITGSAFADTIDGGSGTDTASYGSSRSGYILTKTSNGFSLTSTTGTGNTDVLQNVERLKFTDSALALDVGATQSGGGSALLLGAVLGRAALSAKKPLVGTVIGLFDQGFTGRELSGAIMRLDIWDILAGGKSNTQIANYLLRTVNGVSPDASTLNSAVNSLANDQQGDFLWNLASSTANQTQVGLVGLQQTGLEYS